MTTSFDIVVRTVVRGVANREGVPAHLILGPSMSRNVVRARHEAIRQIASLSPSATPEKIGRALALDRTTVAYALGRLRRKPTTLQVPVPGDAP